MKIISTYILTSALLIFISCQKDSAPAPVQVTTNPSSLKTCNFQPAISYDTNYIPHKLNSKWGYCFCNPSICYDWVATIIKDSTYSKGSNFTIKYSPYDPPHGNMIESVRIDSNGVYHSLMLYAGPGNGLDTVIIIDPRANNGDTIYKNYVKDVYTILIDKNATYLLNNNTQITNCYRINIVCPLKNTTINNYYRKGIGLLNVYGFGLNSLIIR